ncbi:hypothetical protein [Ancylobacter lacus]|uniref:hypothetical protein n=1 Tax=Ancylobacter lacus TaxID=2579970 RepID=UPI001BCD8388|nr:hypothetical protein [Ancylobacter lacus]MBS7537895.1 hypothetical protein [Ancylobacter lacus]
MSCDYPRHRLAVEADAHPNALLRVLEPFAIHDVLPFRIRVDGAAATRPALIAPAALHAEIGFAAPVEVAERLCARLASMPVVREVRLLSTPAHDTAPANVAAVDVAA